MDLLKFNEATKWTEGLPVGNGYTGVLSYGSLKHERLSINNSSLWSGYPKNQNNPESLVYIDKVRQLLDKGKYHRANKLVESKLNGGYSESYMPLGDVFIDITAGEITNYNRYLDLKNGLVYVTSDNLKSELFANYPSNIVCYKLEGKFSLKVTATSKLHYKTYYENDSNIFNLVGNAPDEVVPNYVTKCPNPIRYNEGNGMAFSLSITVDTDGYVVADNNAINVSNASYFKMYFTTATGFTKYNELPIVSTESVVYMSKTRLQNLDYNKLKEEHIQDYQTIYNKNILSISSTEEVNIPTLLKNIKLNNIPNELIEAFYNFGKYLMIQGSRKGGQALNLQGIWNEDIRPAWSSNYTLNINTEMNYWPVSKCNMIECIEPFVDLVYELSQNGMDTAKTNYGVDGFCCNHNTDIWRKTSPVKGNANFMFEPLCGVWLVNELYSHYKNFNYKELKEKMFSIISGATKFVSEYLVKKGEYYLVSPSTSPEAVFTDKVFPCGTSIATAFDMGLVKQLFINYLEMDNSSDFSKEVATKLNSLYPFKQGKLGIQEFYEDKQNSDKGHRHFSPLYCLYPANLITYYGNKQELQMAKDLFESRITHSKNHIGWSAGWGICLASRLHDKQHNEEIIYSLFKNSVFPNLFDAHFPNIFQIDGNFGFIAGVNEMLVYEENGVLELLPSLINNMENGKLIGYVYNGNIINFEWKNNLVTKIECAGKIRVLSKNLSKDIIVSKNVQIVEGIY